MHPQEILAECFDTTEEDFYKWVSKENFERLRFLDKKNLNNDCSESELEELENLDSKIMRNSLNAFKVKEQRIENSGLTWSNFYKYGFTEEDFNRLKYLLESGFSYSNAKELSILKECVRKIATKILGK